MQYEIHTRKGNIMNTTKDWLAMSSVRSNVESINDSTDFTPYYYKDAAGFVEADGHYALWDSLHTVCGLRGDEFDSGFDTIRNAMHDYMNSDDDSIQSVTLPDSLGGLTYYFVKTTSPEIHQD
jgi:hypothetical protein